MSELLEITKQYQEAYNQFITVSDNINVTKKSLDEANVDFSIQQENLNNRIAAIYKNRNEINIFDLFLSIRTFEEFISGIEYFNTIGNNDANLVKHTKLLKENVDNHYAALQKIKKRKEDLLRDLTIKKDQIERNLEIQNILSPILEAEIFRIKKTIFQIDTSKISIVFPVAGPYSYINDWGFPRSGGRTHQGTDIFCSKHTPLVAVTDGIIGPMTVSGLGGRSIRVIGKDGIKYYYTHLNNDNPGTDDGKAPLRLTFAPGIKEGMPVKAGTVIAYSGDSGNAEGTPSHLHFGIYLPSGKAINPYPFLRTADPKLQK